MKRALQGILMAGEDTRDITMDGSKRITIREGHRDYTKGTVLIGCHLLNWVVLANIDNVRHTTLGNVTIEECVADGCSNNNELLTLLGRFYPTIGMDTPVTVISFHLIG